DERLPLRLEAGVPEPHELRLVRRPDGAGAGSRALDQLDRERGDRRRPHVRALLPHARRRSRPHGQRLRPDRLRRPRRRPLLAGRADGGAGRGGAPPPPARPRRGEGRALVGRTDRRLGRPPAVLRHEAGNADPLRRRVLRPRRRPELSRRPDPRVARARLERRVDAAPARVAARAVAAARAVPPARRRARAPLDHALRRGGGARRAPAAPRARGRRYSAAAADGARHALATAAATAGATARLKTLGTT